jgi:hypothetical protein
MPGEMDSRHPWRSGLRPAGQADAQIGYPCRFVELHRSNSLPTAHIRQNPHKGGFVVYGPPGEIRTPDTQVRSLVLYPAELRAEARSLGTVVQKVKNRCNFEQFRSLRSPPNRIEEHQNQRHYQCAEIKTLTGRKTHA